MNIKRNHFKKRCHQFCGEHGNHARWKCFRFWMSLSKNFIQKMRFVHFKYRPKTFCCHLDRYWVCWCSWLSTLLEIASYANQASLNPFPISKITATKKNKTQWKLTAACSSLDFVFKREISHSHNSRCTDEINGEKVPPVTNQFMTANRLNAH